MRRFKWNGIRQTVGSRGMSVAVQGFSNVGSIGAKLMHEKGFKIVAIGDAYTALFKKDGINVEAAMCYAAKNNKSLRGYSEDGINVINNENLLALDVDVLFPAAMENQINANNAAKVRAKIIIEGANGPTTAEDDKIIHEKGVLIVPDILANSGGVVVSYFEWVQNLEAFMLDIDYINGNLEKVMKRAFDNVWQVSTEKGVSLRMAAWMVALDRVVKAKKIRGVFP